jgi:hypothetical protein
MWVHVKCHMSYEGEEETRSNAGTSESDLDYFVRESGDILGVSEKVDQERLAANKENKVWRGRVRASCAGLVTNDFVISPVDICCLVIVS